MSTQFNNKDFQAIDQRTQEIHQELVSLGKELHTLYWQANDTLRKAEYKDIIGDEQIQDAVRVGHIAELQGAVRKAVSAAVSVFCVR